MSKRTVFTTVTSLPAGITRDSVMETLYSHVEMIDLNPLVEERHPVKPPAKAKPEEINCKWYSLTDKVQYLPGGIMSGKVQYYACFHDLPTGIQTHCYAPMGLDIKGKWTLGGSLPGEPVQPQELGVGVPKQGLWLREDVDMRCNFVLTSFVKKTLKKAHSTLVDRLVEKAHLLETTVHNSRLTMNDRASVHSGSHMSYAPSLGQYTTDYSEQSSVRTASPMQSPRMTYQNMNMNQNSMNPRQSMMSTPPMIQNGSPSPSYQSIDPAYQEAAQAMKYIHADGRIQYVTPGQSNNRQSFAPQPSGLAVELPADDGMLLYPQQQPPFQRDLQRSDCGSQRSQHSSQYSQPMSSPPMGDMKNPIAELGGGQAPIDDGMKRHQLRDESLQPRPLNPARSPPPGERYVPPSDNAQEMAA